MATVVDPPPRGSTSGTDAHAIAHPNLMGEAFADQPARTEPHLNEKHDSESDQVAELGAGELAAGEPDSGELTEDNIKDLYVPLPMDLGLPPEEQILTFRAVFVGVILGALVNASNLYLGLKTGFTFGSAMFGAIFGYGIIKGIAKFPLIGGAFGPQENSIIQSAATGSGSMGIAFVGGVPAMYQLHLLSEKPADDFGKIVTITLCSAFFGLFFSTPLRKFFIVQVARELRLMFPTPTATALVIRNMHAGATGAANAIKRLWSLGWSFLGAFVLRIVSQYAYGILWDWHPMTWIHIWSGFTSHAMRIESWGWYIQLTPAFAGSGLLIGLNSALSMLFGSVLAWAIIGPCLVKYGEAAGVPWVPAEKDPEGHWVEYTRYTRLAGLDGDVLPSPRYWLLWPGVFIMLCASMIELFIQWKAIWYALRLVGHGIIRGSNNALQKRGKNVAFLAKRAEKEVAGGEAISEDPALPEHQVKGWVWGVGLVVSIVVMMIIGQFQWSIHPGFSLLSLFLSFIFCFLAIQIGAVTDTTPISSASKASQLVMGAATSGSGDITHNQRINLVSGIVAAGGASVASDLASDFRTGFLLRTPPVKQWIAQTVGLIVAIFLAPALFIVFATAYPCVINTEIDECPFSAPSVAAWSAVATAVTNPNGIKIPRSSGIFAIIMGVVAMIQAVVRHYYLVGPREKYREWLPNWGAAALPMILPNPSILNTAAFGAIAGALWKKWWPNNWEVYAYSVAAGMIAGEGLGGVVNAIITIAGADGDKYGVTIGCPGIGNCEV